MAVRMGITQGSGQMRGLDTAGIGSAVVEDQTRFFATRLSEVECGEKTVSERRAIEHWAEIIPRDERPATRGAVGDAADRPGAESVAGSDARRDLAEFEPG